MITLRVLGTASLESEERKGAASLASQPKALALLVYLAIARPRGFHQRDRLVGLFWPELDQEQARTALRKTIHRMRAALGEDVIVSRGADALMVSTELLRCDAVAFDDAASRGALRMALDLYVDELLPDFNVPGPGGFEDWLERERAYYRERAVDAAWRLTERLSADRELTNASQLARVVARLAATDERMLRRVLRMLITLGDRAGAVEVYSIFRQRLWKEYETLPSQETQQLLHAIQTNAPV